MAAVGAMVGAGIFLLSGATFTVAGGLTLLSVVLAGLIVLLSGLGYAELASGRPGAAGGAYAWVRSALPAPSGFLSGWASWGGHVAATALSALGLGAFLVEFLARSDTPFEPLGGRERLAAVAALGFAVAFHYGRVHVSRRALGRLTLGKVVVLLAFAGVGIVYALLPGPPRGLGAGDAQPGLLGLLVGAGVFFLAFEGFEVIAQLADQTKKPERTVARGILLAVILSLGVYALLVTAVLGNLPSSSVAGWPACEACSGTPEDFALVGFANLPVPGMRGAFLLVGIAVMWGALGANLTAATKTSFEMARDGFLPGRLASVGNRDVPIFALLATAALSASLFAFGLETIAILGSLAFLLLFSFVQASVVTLRRQERRTAPGFRIPLVPAVPIVAVALNIVVGAVLWNYPGAADSRLPAGALATYLGLLWVALGLIFHWFAGGRQAIRVGALAQPEIADVLTAAEDAVELERYRVFLPLREFEDADLVEFAARVARARGAELSLLNVVEIPRNLPPKAIRFRYVDDRIKGLQKVSRLASRFGVDTRPVVKIGHKVYEIILDTLREEAVNLLVTGWRGTRVEGERRMLGSNLDYLIENAPCDIAIFKTEGLRTPLQRLVVLTSPIWPLSGIDELALILAEEDHPAIEVLGLAGDPAEAERLKQEAESFLAEGHARGHSIEHRILYSRQWESVALQESAEASVLLVRASSPGGLRKFALGPVEDRIVKLARCPVLLLRKGAS